MELSFGLEKELLLSLLVRAVVETGKELEVPEKEIVEVLFD